MQGSARKMMWKTLPVRGLLYWYAINNYETAITYMNPRCQLLVRCRQLPIRWKKYKWSKQTQKRSQAQIFFCSFIKVQLPNFLRKKNSHFTIPLSLCFIWLYERQNCPEKDLYGLTRSRIYPQYMLGVSFVRFVRHLALPEAVLVLYNKHTYLKVHLKNHGRQMDRMDWQTWIPK